jgi:hypothetical protein
VQRWPTRRFPSLGSRDVDARIPSRNSQAVLPTSLSPFPLDCWSTWLHTASWYLFFPFVLNLSVITIFPPSHLIVSTVFSCVLHLLPAFVLLISAVKTILEIIVIAAFALGLIVSSVSYVSLAFNFGVVPSTITKHNQMLSAIGQLIISSPIRRFPLVSLARS